MGLGFLFSALFSSAKTATVVGYLWVLGSGIVAGNVMDEFIADERSYVPVLELLPPFGVYRGLFEMSQYAFRGQYRGEGGLTWADLSDDNNGMGRVMGIFVLEFVVFMALAWYLEQVVDDTTGVRRSWGFLWEGWRDKKAQEEGFEKDRVTPVSDEELSGGADVMEERERALGMSAVSVGWKPSRPECGDECRGERCR